LIKVHSKKIYGGYNPIGFKSRSGKWLSCSDSFIFSFENDQDLRNMKISRVINKNDSIFENFNKSFFNFGNHLYISRQNLYLGNYGNYNNIFNNVNVYLPIEEIEVFSVVAK